MNGSYRKIGCLLSKLSAELEREPSCHHCARHLVVGRVREWKAAHCSLCAWLTAIGPDHPLITCSAVRSRVLGAMKAAIPRNVPLSLACWPRTGTISPVGFIGSSSL